MKRVGAPQSSSHVAQEEMLGSAVDLPAQLDTPEHSILEARDERVLHAADDLQGHVALT